MRRDWELIRIILTKVEELPDTRSKFLPRELPGFAADDVNYHLWLLIDAGLIEGDCIGRRDSEMFHCHYYGRALTWRGREFLDMVRSDTAWNRIRKWLNARALDLSFEAIVAAGRAVIAGVDIG